MPSCPNPPQRKGLCWTHYERKRKYGRGIPISTWIHLTPAGYVGKWATLEDRFYNHVRLNGPIPEHAPQLGPCHEWTGHTVKGYGRIGINYQKVYVHRLAYEWAYGPIPPGRQIDHKCHNTICVRSDHLRLATHKENQEHQLGAQRGSKSGIRGVYPAHQNEGWIAQVGHHGKLHHLGTFKTKEEAGEAVRLKRLELFTHNDVDRS